MAQMTISLPFDQDKDYSILVLTERHLVIPVEDIEKRMKELMSGSKSYQELEKLLLNPNYNK